MSTIGAFEAKTQFSRLLARVARGEEITITHRGRPVARLVPAVDDAQATAREAIATLRANRHRRSLGGLDWRTLRDEGRP